MTILTFEVLQRITGPISANGRQEYNAGSAIEALNKFGDETGLNTPLRVSYYLGQLLHESSAFNYDREIWGPTAAQKRYEGRKDLGNTSPGDGSKYRGRSPIQITGKDNYRQFTAWARQLDHTAPDFVADPDAVNTDPWEGLGPIWYWTTRKLNFWADQGDLEHITRIINGGYNGMADRQRWTDRAQLVLAGFDRSDVRGFQARHNLAQDGALGPNTRKALRRVLAALPDYPKSPELHDPPTAAGNPATVSKYVAIGGLIAAIVAALVNFACKLPILNTLISSCGG